jgi:hypothetical protein
MDRKIDEGSTGGSEYTANSSVTHELEIFSSFLFPFFYQFPLSYIPRHGDAFLSFFFFHPVATRKRKHGMAWHGISGN